MRMIAIALCVFYLTVTSIYATQAVMGSVVLHVLLSLASIYLVVYYAVYVARIIERRVKERKAAEEANLKRK